MRYTSAELAQIWQITLPNNSHSGVISEIVYDTRRIAEASDVKESIFVALRSVRNGHEFIRAAYSAGIRFFLIEDAEYSAFKDLEQACFFRVENPLSALQIWAAVHRKKHFMPVIGITGSNGKTVVKEWLYELLKNDFNVYKSPRSFNSQLGVALSILGIEREHQLVIIEAGISRAGDMDALQAMVQPNLCVFTHLGDAHDEGFASQAEKAQEKFKLVKGADVAVFPKDQEIWNEAISAWRKMQPLTKFVSWGKSDRSSYIIESTEKMPFGTRIHFRYRSMEHVLDLPFRDEASISNALTCFTVLTALERWDEAHISAFLKLHPIENRLSIEKGQRQNIIVNDSYSHDIESLRVALRVLEEQSAGKSRAVVLSPMVHAQSVEPLQDLLLSSGVQRVIWVGISQISPKKGLQEEVFENTDALLRSQLLGEISQTALLIKGARLHGLERVVNALKQQLHHTVMEINLDAVRYNYQYFRKHIKTDVKAMVMVKAAGYGSGRYEVAKALESLGADYFGVAYADEAVELRAAGLKAPIMVMNTDGNGLSQCAEHGLEPVIYNERSLKELLTLVKDRNIAIHLELDTGMHRLGFAVGSDWEFLKGLPENIRVRSAFTHLSASENPKMDAFSKEQLEHFKLEKRAIELALGYGIMGHALNSSGIVRFPEYQMDMVRLGIGLYGQETEWDSDLKSVAALYTTLTQIHEVAAGMGIGYGQLDAADHNRKIGTIAIGYADGLLRKFGRGNWEVYINGALAPIVGNVCMDMAMLDVSAIDCKEGDRVEIFGPNRPIKEMARRGETISYEILTTISQRVPRLFVGEF